MSTLELIDRLAVDGVLSAAEFEELLTTYGAPERDRAASLAYRIARERFGAALGVWGVIDLTNFCARDCYYCGLGRSNEAIERYRLTADEVLACCAEGHRLGITAFILNGGDDPELTDDVVEDLAWRIRKGFPDCSLGLAFGERSRESYRRFYDSGADRYLLRHETADPDHFAQLHPRRMTLANRIRCLEDLKAIGFAVGSGMMVGSPFQTPALLAKDLAFLVDFQPASVSIGPFLPSSATRFAGHPTAPIERTLFLTSLLRIALPGVDICVDTAVATAHHRGRELQVMAGANVVTPNLTSLSDRTLFAPYDGKVVLGAEAAEGLDLLRARMADIGYVLAGGAAEAPRPKRRWGR